MNSSSQLDSDQIYTRIMTNFWSMKCVCIPRSKIHRTMNNKYQSMMWNKKISFKNVINNRLRGVVENAQRIKRKSHIEELTRYNLSVRMLKIILWQPLGYCCLHTHSTASSIDKCSLLETKFHNYVLFSIEELIQL